MTNFKQDVIEATQLLNEGLKLKEEFKQISLKALEEISMTVPKIIANELSKEELHEHSKRIEDYNKHLQAIGEDLKTVNKILDEQYGYIFQIGAILNEQT